MSSQNENRVFHNYGEFSLLVKTLLTPHQGFERTLLHVDEE